MFYRIGGVRPAAAFSAWPALLALSAWQVFSSPSRDLLLGARNALSKPGNLRTVNPVEYQPSVALKHHPWCVYRLLSQRAAAGVVAGLLGWAATTVTTLDEAALGLPGAKARRAWPRVSFCLLSLSLFHRCSACCWGCCGRA